MVIISQNIIRYFPGNNHQWTTSNLIYSTPVDRLRCLQAALLQMDCLFCRQSIYKLYNLMELTNLMIIEVMPVVENIRMKMLSRHPLHAIFICSYSTSYSGPT